MFSEKKAIHFCIGTFHGNVPHVTNWYRGKGYANQYRNKGLMKRISAVNNKCNNTGIVPSGVNARYATTL
jgi:hypothetical protein